MGRAVPGPESNRALASLEKRGGAIWAWKRGAGSLVTLTYAGRREGGVVVRGQVSTDMHYGGLVGEIPYEELISLGWRKARSGSLEREWVLHSDVDRAALLRMVDESIELLAPAWGGRPADYRLVRRPAGEEDAGYAQAGCVFTIVSAPVGAVVGALVAFVAGSPLPILAVGALAVTVGAVVGFFGWGWLGPRVLALVPATRARAADLATYGFLLIPGLLALLTWFVAAISGLVDAGEILEFAAAIFGVAIFGSLVLTGLQGLSSRKGKDRDIC